MRAERRVARRGQRGAVLVPRPGAVAAERVDELREQRDGDDGQREAQAAAEDSGREGGEEGGGVGGDGGAGADGRERDAVAGDDEEEGHHGEGAEDDARPGQLQDGRVCLRGEALVALEERSYDVPEKMVDGHDERCQSAHPVDPSGGRNVLWLSAPQGAGKPWTGWTQRPQLLPIHGTETKK